MIIEAHIQCSPEDDFCDHCVGTDKPAVIPRFTEYFIVFLFDGTQLNLCIEHFSEIATLQLD